MATLTKMENGEIRVENTTVLIKGAMERFKFGVPMEAKVNISEVENSIVVDLKEKRQIVQTEHAPLFEDKSTGLWLKYYDGDKCERGRYELRLSNKESRLKEMTKQELTASVLMAIDKMYEQISGFKN